MGTRRILCLFLFVSVLSLGFIACSNDDEPEVEPTPIAKSFFEVEKSGYEVGSKAQTFDVHVRTNITGVSPAILNARETEWISIAIAKQEKENLTYQVSVKENTDSDKRVGNIVFQYSSGGLIEGLNTIVVTQAGTEP